MPIQKFERTGLKFESPYMNKIPILVFSHLKNVVLTMLKSYIYFKYASNCCPIIVKLMYSLWKYISMTWLQYDLWLFYTNVVSVMLRIGKMLSHGFSLCMPFSSFMCFTQLLAFKCLLQCAQVVKNLGSSYVPKICKAMRYVDCGIPEISRLWQSERLCSARMSHLTLN